MTIKTNHEHVLHITDKSLLTYLVLLILLEESASLFYHYFYFFFFSFMILLVRIVFVKLFEYTFIHL